MRKELHDHYIGSLMKTSAVSYYSITLNCWISHGSFFNIINGSVLKTSFSSPETIIRTSFAFEMILKYTNKKCPDLYMDKNLQTLRSWYWFTLYNSCWAPHRFLSAMILSISSIASCFFISMFTFLQTLICSFASSLSLYK